MTKRNGKQKFWDENDPFAQLYEKSQNFRIATRT